MAMQQCVAKRRLLELRGVFGTVSHKALSWADRCTISRRNQMATELVTVDFKMLNGVFFNTLTTKDDEMRLCGGK